MTIDRAVMIFAGCMNLLGIALSVFVHPLWLWLSVFVGLNMIQAAFTGFCPVVRLFAKMGIPEGAAFHVKGSAQ